MARAWHRKGKRKVRRESGQLSKPAMNIKGAELNLMRKHSKIAEAARKEMGGGTATAEKGKEQSWNSYTRYDRDL